VAWILYVNMLMFTWKLLVLIMLTKALLHVASLLGPSYGDLANSDADDQNDIFKKPIKGYGTGSFVVLSATKSKAKT